MDAVQLNNMTSRVCLSSLRFFRVAVSSEAREHGRFCQLSSVPPEAELFQSLIVPKLSFFESWGFSTADVKTLLRKHRQLALLSVEDDIEPVVHFLSGKDPNNDDGFVGSLTPKQIRTVILRLPAILGLRVDVDVRPFLRFWRQDIRLSQSQTTQLLTSSPTLLTYPLECVKAHTFFFHNRRAELSELLDIYTKFPEVLSVPLADLVQLYDYWKVEGLSDKDFMTMIAGHPSLLRLSFSKVLRPMIQYMIFISRYSKGARLLVDRPAVFEMPLAALSSAVEFLLKIGVARRSVVHMLRCCPEILEKDVETELEPRVRSIAASSGLSLQKLAKILPENPEMLTEEPAAQDVEEPSFSRSVTVAVTSCPVF